MVEPPANLTKTLRDLGKSDGTGKGSIRITAGGEVLTKIYSDQYVYANRAPVDSGWIPVYVGMYDGDNGFDIELDPDLPTSEVDVWGGFPFNHGERWAVSYDDKLIWKWRDYRFESAFDHPELIAAYQEYRSTAGRLYINEFGHIYANVPREEVPDDKATELDDLYTQWEQKVDEQNNIAAQRLVNRRLEVTGDGEPEKGHLPLYLGHLSQFDDGVIPRPVIDDETYYVKTARGEELGDY
ncbi:hypothetical protein ACFQO4_18325 [Saliphagus sp. GCM10025334]